MHRIGNSRLSFPDKGEIAAIAIVGALAFAVTLQSPVNLFCITDPYTDSSVFRYVGYEMLHGAMPYLDTFDHKGPVIYLLNYLGMQIGSMRGVWVLEVFFLFLALSALYKTARLVCSRWLAVLSVFVVCAALFRFFQGGNLTEEYALPFIAIAGYLYLREMLGGRTPLFISFISGACLGAVLMLRPNMIAVWVVFCPIVLAKSIRACSGKLLRRASLFLAGVLALCAPILIWLYCNDALYAFVNAYLAFNFSYSGSTADILRAAMRIDALQFFTNDIYIVAALAVAIFFAAREKGIANISWLAYMLASLGLIVLSGMKYLHYGMVFLPTIIYPLALMFQELEHQTMDTKKVAAICACLYLAIVCAVPAWTESGNSAIQRILTSDGYSQTLRETSDYIKTHTKADERITVYGNWDAVYLASNRRSTSRYSYQFPISTVDPRILDTYFAELKANPPKVAVIVSGEPDERMEAFLAAEGYRLATDVEFGADSAPAIYTHE